MIKHFHRQIVVGTGEHTLTYMYVTECSCGWSSPLCLSESAAVRHFEAHVAGLSLGEASPPEHT